ETWCYLTECYFLRFLTSPSPLRFAPNPDLGNPNGSVSWPSEGGFPSVSGCGRPVSATGSLSPPVPHSRAQSAYGCGLSVSGSSSNKEKKRTRLSYKLPRPCQYSKP